jgi:hypothetical protein
LSWWKWLGDGFCDDETNTEGCQFDGGDCCGIDTNTVYCTECLCYEECNAPIELIANGFCNDEVNNAECSFDGSDCCGTNTNTDYCVECLCLEDEEGASIYFQFNEKYIYLNLDY